MRCPNCQTENPEEAVFCVQCGAKLAEKLQARCSACGTELPAGARFCFKCGHPLAEPGPIPIPTPQTPTPPEPTSFADGRYQVKKLLGEGGKKRVYLAHDTRLGRDVAFALIKTEGLDAEARVRITREAQAMGRLGDHPSIVSIYEYGEHEGQPYLVLPLMPGGDVEGLIEKAPDHRLPIEQAVSIAKSVCQGLEFAHSKSIIHRDLKPGNVWMAADGTAKLGDFGLAVATDVSRLTQQAKMVGTFHYMPPEQAMGAEISPKADLYSLGAMLYEMVTGRPPFVGENLYAVVGQHLTTPPVRPSWHREEIPPALEALILHLLEKDPQKRPGSAADVLRALESIQAGKVSDIVSQESSMADRGPFYQRVFVGRESELQRLQSAFDGAVSGQGALRMVVGEPGIGKTAICEQLSTYATLRGGKTLVGHCYEEGSLSLPYLAFVEAMRSYVLTREVDDLKKELGTGAADVARIVSEIRDRLSIRLKPPESPEEERYRLMQGVTGFLTNAAAVQPLLVVLEDLHDADQGTLEMLTHVSRNLSGARLLVVGTYRDVEVDRTHPLSGALAELRRAATYDRVLLRGLNADEVQRMMTAIAGQEVPWGVAEAVHRQTEGNPLFVQEVMRYLREGGLVTREDGQWQPINQTQLEMSIPEGLRDVIGKRLSYLSPECNRILSTAAVIGREFRLQVLQGVADVSDDELFAALEEARGAMVVEERSAVGAAVTYRFTHAFFRQTLYEETIAPRRIRLHQQVAQALEQVHANRLEEHAAELAEHFSYSADPADLGKAVSYGEMAAQRAMSVYAWGEAVRLLEQTLKVQEVLDPEDKGKQCDLLLAMCEALLDLAQLQRIVEVEAPKALLLAEALGDNQRASQACDWALFGLGFLYGMEIGTRYDSPEVVRWIESADRYAQPGTRGRALADMNLGHLSLARRDLTQAVALWRRGLEAGRQLDEPEPFCLGFTALVVYAPAPHRAGERLDMAYEAAQRWRGARTYVLATTLMHIGVVFLEAGQRERAEEAWGELQHLAEARREAWLLTWKLQTDAILAVLDGRLEEVLEVTRRIRARGQELGDNRMFEVVAQLLDWGTLLHLGRVEEALPLSTMPANRALSLAHLGRKAEAMEALEQVVLDYPDIRADDGETGVSQLADLLETSVIVEHRELAGLLMRRLSGSSSLISQPWGMHTSCVARHVGAAAVMLGRPDDGRSYYQEALKVATEMWFRPEVALTRLQLAELLLEHYPDEKAEALEHLDFAIGEFREMKMQPSLERALRRKEILKA